ncbi:radical SAM family heme chaperone HemW [Oceaniglobus trochenteri]|uniref:radical SAM family heme chaperone HemW n=1 Tax=Oceaniglobus trochenteri TaxID=2763260 RepID=UPI001CFFB3AC|nr:radical SAM family heme chaperone HemW [Oceaniglobus trochenteri]
MMIEGGFGLYVHWPFCQSKCPYCDFNSHVTAHVDHSRWRDALVAEVQRYARLVPDRVLQTIFFGGGTPSLMDPDTTHAVIEAARAAWPCANDMEISLEANPTSVEAGRFKAFREAGVNRVSMGIQALNDTDLRALGRLHSVKDAKAAFGIARQNFDRVSFDLIYSRQNQTLENWRSELTEAIGMAVDHLSLYQLTIEDGTAFGDRMARGLLRGLPDEDRAADMYFATQEICDAHGLNGYETSNHAKPGSESRHNLIYWRYGDYVGVGPGAHGRLTIDGQKIATDAIMQPGKWLAAVENPELVADRQEILTNLDQATEMLMMGMRLAEGISLPRYEEIGGTPLCASTIRQLAEQELISFEDGRLRTTNSGRPLLNAILRELLAR